LLEGSSEIARIRITLFSLSVPAEGGKFGHQFAVDSLEPHQGTGRFNQFILRREGADDIIDKMLSRKSRFLSIICTKP